MIQSCRHWLLLFRMENATRILGAWLVYPSSRARVRPLCRLLSLPIYRELVQRPEPHSNTVTNTLISGIYHSSKVRPNYLVEGASVLEVITTESEDAQKTYYRSMMPSPLCTTWSSAVLGPFSLSCTTWLEESVSASVSSFDWEQIFPARRLPWRKPLMLQPRPMADLPRRTMRRSSQRSSNRV